MELVLPTFSVGLAEFAEEFTLSTFSVDPAKFAEEL
jgi:hypothetical protein